MFLRPFPPSIVQIAQQQVYEAVRVCQASFESALPRAVQHVAEVEEKFRREAARAQVAVPVTQASEELSAVNRLIKETGALKGLEGLEKEIEEAKLGRDKAEADLKSLQDMSFNSRDVQNEMVRMLCERLEGERKRFDRLMGYKRARCPLFHLHEIAQELKEARSAASSRRKHSSSNTRAFSKASDEVRSSWGQLRHSLYKQLIKSQRTLLLYDGRCGLHKTPSFHRERPERMQEAEFAFRTLNTSHPRGYELRPSIDNRRHFPLYIDHGRDKGFIKEVGRQGARVK